MNSQKLNVALAAPVLTYASTSTVGGSLATATTFFYRVSPTMAYGAGGPLPGSAAGSTGIFEGLAVAQGAGQLTGAGNTNTVTITWTAVPGATGYNIYGRLTGAPFLLATVPASVLTFTDTGALPLGTQTVIGASTALAGNCFLPGGNVGALAGFAGGSQGFVAGSPFVAGRTVTVANPTGGAIVLSGSPDGITAFSTNFILSPQGVAVTTIPSLSFVDIVLPNFTVAASAGLYLLGSS